MKMPIIAYGDPVLRKKAVAVEPDEYPNIKQLVEDMFETMYGARGVGLAAPQVGIRIFPGWNEVLEPCSPSGSKIRGLFERPNLFLTPSAQRLSQANGYV